MLLSAIAYNIHKLLKHQLKQVVSLALPIQPASLRLLKRSFKPYLSKKHFLFEYSLT
jgi:hypothetical protein